MEPVERAPRLQGIIPSTPGDPGEDSDNIGHRAEWRPPFTLARPLQMAFSFFKQSHGDRAELQCRLHKPGVAGRR